MGFALSKNDAAVKCYMGDTGLLVSLAFSENELSDQQLYKAIMGGRLSLNDFRELFSGRIARSYIIHPKSYVKEERITRIPPYMFFCLFR